MLADLRIGLSFDVPKVKEKLVKTLADYLDENVLVRYHLSTVLAVVGCKHPACRGERRARRTVHPIGECPHCGLALREGGLPMCPQCGAPS